MVNRDTATPFNPKCACGNAYSLEWGLQENDTYTICNYPSLVTVATTGYFNDDPALVVINAPKLVTATDIEISAVVSVENNSLVAMFFQALSLAHVLRIGNAFYLEILNISSLVECSFYLQIAGDATRTLPLIASIPRLAKCYSLSISYCSNITIDISTLVDSSYLANNDGDIGITNCPYLTTITLSPLAGLANSALYMGFTSNALTQANIDQILSRVDGWGRSSGAIDLSNTVGGTNAAPTGGAANANVVSLQGKGWTVTHA